ncbi:unnamed protein product [Rotaria sp. Silwood1]|nr:unnamed protein product [Rotaria sp. Silwood1]
MQRKGLDGKTVKVSTNKGPTYCFDLDSGNFRNDLIEHVAHDRLKLAVLEFKHFNLYYCDMCCRETKLQFRRLYPNVATRLYLQSQIQVALTYRYLTLNLTDSEAQNIATLQWHEQSMEMINGLYQIENTFGHKFIIPREQDHRVYIGNAVPIEPRIFRLEHVRYREYRVRHYQSNRTLCAYQQSLINETPLVLESHTDQTFTFECVDDDNKEYYIWPAHQRSISRSKVLDVHNDPYGHAGQDGAQRRLYPNVATRLYLQSQIQAALTYRYLTLNLTDSEAQNIATLQWHEQSMEMINGLYQIENIFGHKFLIPRDQDNRVYIGTAVPIEQRIFRLEHVRYREYRIRHYQSNRTLCAYQQSLINETPLVLESHTDQTFTFECVDDDNKEYYIWPAHQRSISRSKVLDVHNDPYGHAAQDGAQVQLYSYHGGLNQRFRLHAVDENIVMSSYTITKMV